MRISKPLCLLSGVAVLLAGCADAEAKLGRGMANAWEPLRMGEMQRSYEQSWLYDGPDVAMTRGLVEGFDRTISRTAVGLFEILTFPIPTDPIIKPVNPVYPDSFTPRASVNSSIETDTNLGFDGQDVMPWLPGSRFTIFGN